MSIYSVSIKKWYLDPESAFHKELEMLRSILPHIKCYRCGGTVTEKSGWVSHAITFNGGFEEQTFCSIKCKDSRK